MSKIKSIKEIKKDLRKIAEDIAQRAQAEFWDEQASCAVCEILTESKDLALKSARLLYLYEEIKGGDSNV